MSAAAIGKRIAMLRAERELTQEQLGAKVKRSRSAIAQWETGISSPSAGVLVALAKALETSVDAILGGRAA